MKTPTTVQFGPKITPSPLPEGEFLREYENLFSQTFDLANILQFFDFVTKNVYMMPNHIAVVKGISGYEIYVLSFIVEAKRYDLHEEYHRR